MHIVQVSLQCIILSQNRCQEVEVWIFSPPVTIVVILLEKVFDIVDSDEVDFDDCPTQLISTRIFICVP